MVVPLFYNVCSLKSRWTSTLVAVLGIAGTVGVFITMMSLAFGFRTALVSSGSENNAIAMHTGATSELTSMVSLDVIKTLARIPGISQPAGGPLLSPEAVVIANVPLISSAADANVQFRGVSPQARQVRPKFKIIEGRMFNPDTPEIIVGRNALHTYQGLSIGSHVDLGGGTWVVVGIFEMGGSAIDSEIWCDYKLLNRIYHRPENLVQSILIPLTSPSALQQVQTFLGTERGLNLFATSETEYYAKQSYTSMKLMLTFGVIIAIIMGFGAVLGALNTMYSAISERAREIATFSALGFSSSSIVVAFSLEALLISFAGGVFGCALILPLNGAATATLNLQTFTHMAFAFNITPFLLFFGMLFALLMGLAGGLPPAIRAARRPVSEALRAL